MNERVSWKFRGVYSDGLAFMTLVTAGDLESMVALRAANQYSLALAPIMEPLKEMYSSKRNSLSSSAIVAREGNLPPPGKHDHPGTACKAG